MKKIHNGILSELELVKTFGTLKQIATYEKNGMFTSSNKNTLLNKARQYCDVNDLGDRKYDISKIKEIPTTKSYEKIHDDLYGYICPLLLERLTSEKKSLTFTIGHWAREINMVNDNYTLVKYNLDKALIQIAPIQNTPKPLAIDFYNHCDSMISSYMIQSLKYLCDLGLIIWREVYMVTTKKIKCSKIVNREVCLDIETETHQATEEEMDFYAKCVGIADRNNNIQDNSINERYYSNKAKRWARSLQLALEKRHIDKVFKCYEVYATNYIKCKKVLDMYDFNSQEHIVQQFNEKFIAKLNLNAENRYNKQPDKYNLMMELEGDCFLDGYDNITRFVIGDVESCEDIIGTKEE